MKLDAEQFEKSLNNYCKINLHYNPNEDLLIRCLKYNLIAKLGLTKNNFIDLISVSDLKATDDAARNALTIAIVNNKSQKLNFDTKIWEVLIKNSDLNNTDANGLNALMYIAVNYQAENLNFNKSQMDYIIYNINNTKSKYNLYSNLMVLLMNFNKIDREIITDKEFKYLIKNSDLSLINNNKSWQNEHKPAYILYKTLIEKYTLEDNLKFKDYKPQKCKI